MASIASGAVAFAPQMTLEDPLAHLPCSTIVEYKKGQSIYSLDRPATGIYLIIAGTVKVCRIAEDGRQVVADIYRVDDFFGESALLGPARSRPRPAAGCDAVRGGSAGRGGLSLRRRRRAAHV